MWRGGRLAATYCGDCGLVLHHWRGCPHVGKYDYTTL